MAPHNLGTGAVPRPPVLPTLWLRSSAHSLLSNALPTCLLAYSLQSLYLSFLSWDWPIAILSFPGLFHRRFLGFFLARFSLLSFSMITLGNFLLSSYLFFPAWLPLSQKMMPTPYLLLLAFLVSLPYSITSKQNLPVVWMDLSRSDAFLMDDPLSGASAKSDTLVEVTQRACFQLFRPTSSEHSYRMHQ